MAEPSKILGRRELTRLATKTVGQEWIGIVDHDSALRSLVAELTHALEGRGYHECAVCDDCTFKKLIDRANAVSDG